MSDQELWNLFLEKLIHACNVWIENDCRSFVAEENGAPEGDIFLMRNVGFGDVFNMIDHDDRPRTMDDVLESFKVPKWQFLCDYELYWPPNGGETILDGMCKLWPEFNAVRILYV